MGLIKIYLIRVPFSKIPPKHSISLHPTVQYELYNDPNWNNLLVIICWQLAIRGKIGGGKLVWFGSLPTLGKEFVSFC